MTEDKRPPGPSVNPAGVDRDRSIDPWSTYWDHGFLTSCADAFDENYQGRIRGVWERFLDSVPDGGRVLDICTGNGAIAVIARDTAVRLNRRFEVHGIDSARIHPIDTLKTGPETVETIVFHSETGAEDTGFPDAYFDAVTGQYALEYTDVPATISELYRVMKPGARALFVMHHADSVVLDTTSEELRHGTLLFEETRLFERARQLLGIMVAADTPAKRAALAQNPEAEQARLALNEAAAAVTKTLDTTSHPEMLRTALGYVSEAFRRLDSPGGSACLEELARGHRELAANVGRLDDLVNAALDAGDAEKTAALMTSAGFETDGPDTLMHESRLVGWTLGVSKPL